MKLLIVDDEQLTREGLLSSIDWESLGITELFEADDGTNGLACALKHRPEIILCDVRMPRMNGIAMVEQLQDTLPDTVVIFMSGYSDKEYLKAAIKLKAVSYVEKPLNPAEVQEAVIEAADYYRKNQLNHRSQTWQYQETTSKLAMQLSLPYEKNREMIRDLCETLSLKKMDNMYFTAFLIKVVKEDLLENDALFLFLKDLNDFLADYSYSSVMIEKYQSYMVFFLYGKERLEAPQKHTIHTFFQSRISSYGTYFMCCGRSEYGISRAYLSYENAVILMQSSFFFDPDTVLTPELVERQRPDGNASFAPIDAVSQFTEALLDKDHVRCQTLLDSCYQHFYRNTGALWDQARDVYYKLFSALLDVCHRMKISDKKILHSNSSTVIRYLEQFYSYAQLHQALTDGVGQYFIELDNLVEEHTTIFLIKEYIGKNYAQENLSVKDISAHIYMSVSYLCTLFKNETGQTLNQYITEFRMEKAKKLLQDPRYKISDVSLKVGYSDGNYFGKIFKKAVGLSPSDYREKMIQ